MSVDAAEALTTLASTPRLLVALDFDGTLSPLEDDPMASRMLPAARDAVAALSALPDTVVALVSGRSMSDLRLIAEHLDDSPLWLAGSHGAEYWEPGSGLRPADDDPDAAALRDRLQQRAEEATAHLEGVWIEPKAFGLGVHTRRADAAAAAEANRLVDEIVAEQAPAWRRRSGRDIVEYASRHEGKDSAVEALRERTGATAVLFAGDDVTDEDALGSLKPGDLGVRVGEGDTVATMTVAGIPELAALLMGLAEARARR
ncbi:trehalose-phosphatase [Microbacterium jiangjiandongii]|uniref:trehalose-phosphatase n=1 Tax=Microbacterium jiangjiandongii TaxID=3049071 RepID=UPI00214C088C|nr:trehalose-phosphatase [Microbacterium sp. zg.Y843]MCR2814336.1 trehalose-phosphatase [Microbacterium sp. zg.Y843]